MDVHKLQVKVFCDSGTVPAGKTLEDFIPVFHGFIKNHSIKETLIDVANYAHVPDGPGVALIGNGGDYFLDEEKGRAGLIYSRKREAPPPGDRLVDTFRRAFFAGILLEKEAAFAGKLKFRTDEILFRVNDRLLAPSTDATFAALRPALDVVGRVLFAGAPFELSRTGTDRELFGVTFKSAPVAGLSVLLQRLGGDPPAEGAQAS